jgi:hypothetical protein
MRTLWLLVVEAADDISNERSPKHPTPRMCASRSGPEVRLWEITLVKRRSLTLVDQRCSPVGNRRGLGRG